MTERQTSTTHTIWSLTFLLCLGCGEGRRGEGGDGDADSDSDSDADADFLEGAEILAVGVGQRDACMLLREAGQVACWGDVFEADVPTLRPEVDGIAELALGGLHACGRTIHGTGVCVGRNLEGELGDGTTDDRVEPTEVLGLGNIEHIAAGTYHTCAVDSGQLYCWGANDDGQLGDGTTQSRAEPSPVALPNVAEVAPAWKHTCARDFGGRAWCWGRNSSGELGVDSEDRSLSPLAIDPLGEEVTSITTGDRFSCAVVEDGSTYCWGDRPDTEPGSPELVRVELPGEATAVAAGSDHACARMESDEVWCWGSNGQGQLGDGTTTDRQEPVLALDRVSSLSAHLGEHSCALRVDGTVWCWGSNWAGQIGDGTSLDALSPKEVGSGNASRIER